MLVPLQKEPVIRGARGRVGGSEEAEKAEEEYKNEEEELAEEEEGKVQLKFFICWRPAFPHHSALSPRLVRVSYEVVRHSLVHSTMGQDEEEEEEEEDEKEEEEEG